MTKNEFLLYKSQLNWALNIVLLVDDLKPEVFEWTLSLLVRIYSNRNDWDSLQFQDNEILGHRVAMVMNNGDQIALGMGPTKREAMFEALIDANREF